MRKPACLIEIISSISVLNSFKKDFFKDFIAEYADCALGD